MNNPQRLTPLFPSSRFDVVAIAASAGGIKTLSQFLPQLPDDFAIAILLVMHLDPHASSLLPQVLNRMTSLTVKDAAPGDSLQAGTLYTAPPDHHLLVAADSTLYLSHTGEVNFTRPAADCTFQSVAERFGERAIAIILTGNGHDGAAGAKAIKQHGGRVLVQDPAEALFASMPQSAIDTYPVDGVLPVEQLVQTLIKLVQQDEG